MRDYTDAEVRIFLHNAQNAIVDTIEDNEIPVIYYYKTELTKLLKDNTKLTNKQLAAVLMSAAYDVFTGGKEIEKVSSNRGPSLRMGQKRKSKRKVDKTARP